MNKGRTHGAINPGFVCAGKAVKVGAEVAIPVNQRSGASAHIRARLRMRNTTVWADGRRTAATVASSIGWLDLVQRRLTKPSDDLHRLVADLPRTEDFAELPSLPNKDVRGREKLARVM